MKRNDEPITATLIKPKTELGTIDHWILVGLGVFVIFPLAGMLIWWIDTMLR